MSQAAHTGTAMRTIPRARPRSSRSRTSGQHHRLIPYLFISPFYILYILFLLGPTVYAFWLSLHEWAGIGPTRWVGLSNYSRLFGDTAFRQAVTNTLWYVAASVFVVTPLALIIAAALNTRGLRGRDLFRMAYFAPMVLSPVVVALVFTIIFDQQFGLLNAGLRGLIGIKPVNWLGSPGWAKVAIVLLLMWRWTGYLVIYFLAGLQSVPRELYEAAEIDGAGALRKFWEVTIPMLKPVTAFVAITVFIGAAQIFEEPYILTKGGPGQSTMSIAHFIYRAAFIREDFGYAAAAGVLLFVVVFVLTRVLAHLFGVGREERA